MLTFHNNIINAEVVLAFVPLPGETTAVYAVPENLGPISVCVEVIMGGLAPGQTATVEFSTNEDTAQGELFQI